MVSIRLIISEGIINKAFESVNNYQEGEIKEQIRLAYSEWEIAKWDGTAGDIATFIKNRLQSIFGESKVNLILYTN